MPRRSNVQLTTPDATPRAKSIVSDLPVNDRPLYPWSGPDVFIPQGHEAPYPGDLTAGDGADRSFRPNPSGVYSTNVPQPDNRQAPSKASGDGMNGMAG